MIFNCKKTDNTPQLDPNTAGQMLQNVFDVCEMESNSVPLDVMESYALYRKERVLLQKIILITFMVLFCLLPLLFIPPKFKIENNDGKVFNSSYEITIDKGIIPIRQINASIDGQDIPVYTKQKDTFFVIPKKNGDLTVTVQLKNHQYITKHFEVENVDNKSPYVVSTSSTNSQALIYIADDHSGIDYKTIYAVTSLGDRIYPDFIDKDSGLIIFDIVDSELNVFIFDKSENSLQLIVKTSNNNKENND